MSFVEAVDLEMLEEHLEACFSACSVVELSGLAYCWREWWARDSQLVDFDGVMSSHGILAGRGFGKTRAHTEAVLEQIITGKARMIGLLAQNEDETRQVLVEGVSGLVTISPPWFRPQWIKGQVVWPNGATAIPYTAEKPSNIRGNEHDIFLHTECCVWPVTTREEVYKNILFSTRIGGALVLWDTTPRRKHPIVRKLMRAHEARPLQNVVIRGSTDDNASNLARDFIDNIDAEYSGTQAEQEERHGVFLDDDENALWKSDWIERGRRSMPSKLVRRVIAVDPAISIRKGTDATGIVELGLGVDGQIYVLEDLSGKLAWEEWIALVVDRYMIKKCDCVIVERNRGGDAITASLRGAGRERGIEVVKVAHGGITYARADTIYVKEVIGRSNKETRAEPAANMYELGKVSHVNGIDLDDLEEQLLTWEPDPRVPSPNALDALVWGIWELADLGIDRRSGRADLQALGVVKTASTKTDRGRVHSPLARGRGGRRVT